MPLPSEVLTLTDVSQSIDDNSLRTFDFDDLGSTIWIAAVIDETSDAAALCCVNHGVFVDPE